jgi:ABC-2 type transport system ATP-binding protein
MTNATPEPACAIELEGFTKDYRSVRALDAVSARVPLGRVGLLGPNGAGKSTMVKCLLGLVRATAGRASVLGFRVDREPLGIRRRVGYLPENDCHVPGMTATEFVAYAGELSGLRPDDAWKRAHEVLDYVGMAEERYRPVDTFSTGMRQKVKLAQAIVHDPELLFLDEPTNGLDPEGRERMLDLVLDLGKSHGIGLVYSSHLLGDVERVCDSVLVLQGGRVLSQGRIEDLRRGDRNSWDVRVKGETAAFAAKLREAGARPEEAAPGLFRVAVPEGGAAPSRLVFEAARASGVQVRSFQPARTTLEDVFLELLEAPARGETPGRT